MRSRGTRFSLLFAAVVLLLACSQDPEGIPGTQVTIDSTRLADDGLLDVHFDPPVILGPVFFLQRSGGRLYVLSPANDAAGARYSVVDDGSFAIQTSAKWWTSAQLRLPPLRDGERAKLCFDQGMSHCVTVWSK